MRIIKARIRRSLLFRLIRNYIEYILPGIKIYNKIRKNKSTYVLVHGWPGMGDIFLIHEYLEEYLKNNSITNYMIVVSGKAAWQVAMLFEKQENIILVDKEEKDSLIKLKQFMGNKIDYLRVLHHDPPVSHTSIGKNIQGYKKTTTKDMLLGAALGIKGNEKDIKLPVFDFNESLVNTFFEKNELIPGKTVIISPYANSCANAFPIEVYSLIANSLKRMGFSVGTNINGKEKELPGTVALHFLVKDAKSILEKAGYFISMRSGLCDVVGKVKCKQVVLYNANSHCGRNQENSYFSLSKIGLGNDDILELNVNQNKIDEAVCEILYQFALDAQDCTERQDIIDKYERLDWKRKRELFLLPAFSERNVAVAFSSSNEYVPFLNVALLSILDHINIEYNYDIIIFEDDMTTDNKRILSMLASDNVSIRFVDISSIISQYDLYTWGWYRLIMYGRFLIPDLLSQYDKILYLDSDIVVLSDIAELYNYRFKNNELIAAAIDVGMVNLYCLPNSKEKEYFDEVLELHDPLKYINSGVILFNNYEVRKQYTSDELLQYVQSRNWMWQDQDVFMKLFEGKISYIDQKWNVMIQAMAGGYEKMGHDAPYDLQIAYEQALLHPYIVHFIENKMMYMNPISPHFDKFWKYARESYYYEVLLSKKKEMY